MKDAKLKDACRRFRDRFEPGSPDAHRDECGDCSRFADILEESASVEIRQPMSSRLRQRLRGIPRYEVTCRDQDRLYRATLRRVSPDRGDHDPAAEQHLETCVRCRDLYGTLLCAFTPEPRTLPTRLAQRLTSIARHPQRLLPLWISDSRYAAAACYLLASLTLAVTEDASALFRQTTTAVSSKAVVWTDAGETRGVEVWDAASSTLHRGLTASWNRVQHYGAHSERLLFDALRTIEDTTHQLIPDRDRSVGGDYDD